MRAVTPLSLALVAWLAGGVAGKADPTPPGPILAQALDSAAAGDWTEATVRAGSTGVPVALDILLWLRLAGGGGEFDEYRRFMSRNADWPLMDTLHKAAERSMPEGLPPQTTLDFFDRRQPVTGTGSLRLAEALASAGRGTEAEAEIVRAWTRFSMTGYERSAAMKRWGAVLKPQHVVRLDMLLWRGLTGEARAMLPLVPDDWRQLAEARIATRRDEQGLQYLIDTVPATVERDPGLAYERYLYRVTKRRWQDAEDFLLEHSTSQAALGRPEFWMERRANLARQALEDGDTRGAYWIAAQNFGSRGPDYADSEWVAGFIALTRLGEPKRAVGHFTRFQSAVASPISLGRAGYWLGIAYRELGEEEAAEHAFRSAAIWSTSFYGQMAARELDEQPEQQTTGKSPDWRTAGVSDAPVVQAGLLLLRAGDKGRGTTFLRAAAAGKPAGLRAALSQMAIDLGWPEVGIRIAKDAAAEAIVLTEQYYPLHPIADEIWPVPSSYALAIARQESEFNAGAESSVGARGLMQLMPATARQMAELEGIAYDQGRLTKDAVYNARLGTAYLASLLRRYGGSYLLATAAYNAGPGRADQWIEDLGDPRLPGADMARWIESIPYAETRNYVMRVLEGLEVYAARLEVTGAYAPMQEPADGNRASDDTG